MRPRVIVASLVVIAIALLAMLWGSTYSVPDLVRIDYGLPLRWGANTLDTLAGPVDKWSVEVMSLALDLVFWFMTLILAQFLVSRSG